MLVKTYTAALVSVDAHLVTVEVNVEPGVAVTLVGLPDTSVKESYQRIETAAEYSGYRLHGFQIGICADGAAVNTYCIVIGTRAVCAVCIATC